MEKGLAFPKHSAVIAAFGQHFVKTGMVPAEFQRYLTEGQAARNISDYDTGPAVTAADASQQISRAQEFVELAYRLLGNAPSPSGQGG